MTRAWIAFVTALAVIPRAAVAQQPESRAASRPAAADKITLELVPPPARGPQPSEAKGGVEAAGSRPAESRGAPPVAVIRITNKGTEEATLWPFVSLKIRNEKGEEPKPSTNLGRWGRRKSACFLEAVTFLTLEPGKSIEWPVRPDRYMHDPASILGWKLAAGDYTLTARYSYSRADFVARCKLECESHPDPGRPWNRALELSREATLKITVK
jgi:hypothetical protein